MGTAHAQVELTPEAARLALDALPPHVVGEIIEGVLYTHARPARRHARAQLRLGGRLDRDGSGPAGQWVIVPEPELHLDDDTLVPDLAGWRTDRLPATDGEPFFTTVPDWVCEVLSPSTARVDRVKKSRVYARSGVTWMWLLDPERRTLEVRRLAQDGYYAVLHEYDDTETVRAEPFAHVEFRLPDLWPDAE